MQQHKTDLDAWLQNVPVNGTVACANVSEMADDAQQLLSLVAGITPVQCGVVILIRFDMFNVLGGNWDPTVCLLTVFGPVMQYIQWAGAEGHDPFFTDPDVKPLFKNHIDVMVNRRNTINNRLYKDDPAIFAWDLMNEPRCDCFPDFIPVPESYVSCRPECAKKVQVAVHVMWSLCCIV